VNFSRLKRNLPGRQRDILVEKNCMNDRADRVYEQVLVLRCKAGDGAAFEELVALYGPRLRYYVRKMLGHAQITEDVLQEVWLDVYRALPRLAQVAAFPAWIYRIVRDHTHCSRSGD
jgi:RNA polymerase sigma-70 factor (ECF subfamily)